MKTLQRNTSKSLHICKVIVLFVLLASVLLLTFACNTRQDAVLDSLGKYDSKQLWTYGEFQDYTDYGIYSYSSVNLEDNKYFAPVSSDNMDTIFEFIDDFEGWIKTHRENDPDHELVVNYAFDRSIIDTADYFYIHTKYEDSPMHNYDIWLWDTQANTLYYFHNNI